MDGPVRVEHGTLARALLAIDAAFGECVRTMVRRRHDHLERGLAGRRMLVERAQHLREQRLVRNAPDRLLDDLFARNRRAILDRVAVALEERIHVVEIAVAAIEEVARIAILAERLAERAQVFVVRTAQNRLPRRRRHGERDGFEAAHRARARRIHVVERERVLRQVIEIRRQAVLGAKRPAERCAQALDRDDDDIRLLARQRIFVFDIAQRRLIIGKRDVRRGQHLAQAVARGRAVCRLVERPVVELVRKERMNEFIRAVACKLVVVAVLRQMRAPVRRRATHGGGRQHEENADERQRAPPRPRKRRRQPT